MFSYIIYTCGYNLVVECHASDLIARVRFSLPAPKIKLFILDKSKRTPISNSKLWHSQWIILIIQWECKTIATLAIVLHWTWMFLFYATLIATTKHPLSVSAKHSIPFSFNALPKGSSWRMDTSWNPLISSP